MKALFTLVFGAVNENVSLQRRAVQQQCTEIQAATLRMSSALSPALAHCYLSAPLPFSQTQFRLSAHTRAVTCRSFHMAASNKASAGVLPGHAPFNTELSEHFHSSMVDESLAEFTLGCMRA